MENINESDKKQEVKENKILTRGDLVSFAMDVGFSISLPLAGFIFIGHLLDKNFDTKPLFLIIGLLLSLATTTVIIGKKIKKFYN